jgi:phage shock protein PspC (stress-responsive transcriptional regulator)
VAGVCGGIAAFTGAPPTAVRVVVALSLVPSIGVTAVGYLLLWWLVPVAG